MQISLNHNFCSSEERLNGDTNFLSLFLFVHFLSSAFMLLCGLWGLVQKLFKYSCAWLVLQVLCTACPGAAPTKHFIKHLLH